MIQLEVYVGHPVQTHDYPELPLLSRDAHEVSHAFPQLTPVSIHYRIE